MSIRIYDVASNKDLDHRTMYTYAPTLINKITTNILKSLDILLEFYVIFELHVVCLIIKREKNMNMPELLYIASNKSHEVALANRFRKSELYNYRIF